MADSERIELFGGLAALERDGTTLHWSAEPGARWAMQAALTERAERAEVAIAPVVGELRDLLARYDPIDVVAQCAVVATTGHPERDDAATHFGLTARVEYIAGLALSLPSRAMQPAEPGIPQRAWSLAGRIFELEHETLMAPGPADLPHEVASARFLLRMEALLDRMQGYAMHLETMLERAFAPIADDCRADLGFSPADLPTLVRSCWRAAQQSFQEVLDGIAEEVAPVRESLPAHTDDEFATATSAYAIQEVARSTFAWTPDQIADASGVAEGEVAAMLAALSCSWNCQPSYRRPTDINRFRRFPVIDLLDGRYFFPLGWSPLHEAVPWFLTVVRECGLEKLEARFLKARDRAAESLARESLAGAFGADRVLGPLAYDPDGEVDGVVDGGAFVLVAEAKAHHCLSVAVLAFVPVAGTASPTSGLRGKVTVSPSRPVCIEGQPCSKPAPGVLIGFRRDGRTVARVTTRADATYRVILRPGTYTVVAPQYRRGSGVTPRTVRVPKGRIAHVDLEIDTGIQ